MVIPTYRAEAADGVARIVDALSGPGVFCVAVANSRAVLRELLSRAVEVVTGGENLGFGAAVNLAADYCSSSWIWVVNDDITICRGQLALDDLVNRVPDSGVVVVTPNKPYEPRELPGPWRVFCRLSALEKVFRASQGSASRATDRVGGSGSIPCGYSAGFSFVGVRRQEWEKVGGFNPRLKLYFEDDEFMRRFWQLGDVSAAWVSADYVHYGSATTREYLKDIIPVVADSAKGYLGKHASVVSAALVVRLASVPFHSNVLRRAEVIGICRALRLVASGKAPNLPPYDS